MNQINIKEILFDSLQIEYKLAEREKRYTAQLHNGFDLLEANIKFIAILLLAILKNEDSEAYQKVFSAFRSKSSLGNYYFILLEALNVKCDSDLFHTIKSVLSQKVNLELETASTILFGQNQIKKIDTFLNIENRKPNNKIDSILSYGLDFRNRIKGHSATFRDEEKSYAKRILKNLGGLLQTIQEYTNKILSNNAFDFYTTNYLESNINLQNHHQHKLRKIIAKFNNKKYELSPMIAYIECDRYSCSINHRNKIFFINEVENSKSFYLDYLYNHMWRVNTTGNDWKVASFENDVKNFYKNMKLFYSNKNKYFELTSNFIGRENELIEIKNHILNNYQNNTLSIISGKPGIGKSSFATQLQKQLSDEKEDLITYIFYAIKNQNTDNEYTYFLDSVKKFLKNNKINITIDKDSEINELNQYFEAVKKSGKTFLLIIDGLDELSNAVGFLQNLQLLQVSSSNNLHLIMTTRAYKNILKTLSSICSYLDYFRINNADKVNEIGYSLELNSLNENETRVLIEELLPKEVQSKNSEIVDMIIAKSESLPIYIHFISQNLKELTLKNNLSYKEELIAWAKKLPKKLDNFYIGSFKDLDSLSRKILLSIFFAPYGVSLDELYILLASHTMDKVEFENKYFAPIEIFLREIEDDYYGFYHLSVKDAIFKYYASRGDVLTISMEEITKDLDSEYLQTFFNDSGYYEEFSNTIEQFYGANLDGDFYNILDSLINTTKKDIANQKLSRYIDKNFFYMFYNNCMILYTTENLNSLQNEPILTNKIKLKIKDYINSVQLHSSKENTENIKYGYNLAMIDGNYQKALEFSEMYNNAILEVFIRICSDIDKHKDEFMARIDEWKNNIDDEQKELLIKIASLKSNNIEWIYSI